MKRRPEEHVNHERWLVSYADLITLLFALFVILYAMSQADLAKFKKVQESIRAAFDGAPTAKPAAEKSRVQDSEGKTEAGAKSALSDSKLADAGQMLRKSLALEAGVSAVADHISVADDDRGLVVRMSAKDFFDDGATEVRPELRPILDRVGRVIGEVPNSVRVEGHTDEEEEKRLTGTRSGWELSAERAAWVVRYWVRRLALDPARFTAAGLSRFHPLKSGDAWSRGDNRRIEIVILKSH